MAVKQGILFGISVVFLTILFIFVTGVVLVLSIPLAIYRKFVQVVARIWRRDLAQIVCSHQQLIAHDDFFEDKVAFNIVAWQVVEGCLSVDGLQKMVMENMINYRKPNGELEFPEFRQYMTTFGGYLFWKEDVKFDINNHVRFLELGIEAEECTERDLQRIISRLTSARWTRNRAFWEILVVNNYKSARSSGESVMIFRFHHSLADGYSYLNFVVRRLCGGGNLVSAIPNPRVDSKLGTCIQALMAPLRLPYDFVRLFAERNHDQNPWMVEREQLRKQFTTVWSEQVEMKVIKELKRKFGVSFQAVLSSVIGGTIRRLMEREGQDVPEIMTAFIPFPKKNHPGGLKIHTYFSLVKVPVRETDPEKRLQLTQSFWTKEVASTARFMSHKVFGFAGWLPYAVSKRVGNHYTTVGFSCFPGIDGDIYLGKHKAYEVNFTVGTDTGNTGATFSTLSCFGKLRFNMTIDKAIYPSEDIADAFSGFIKEEIQSLLDMALLIHEH